MSFPEEIIKAMHFLLNVLPLLSVRKSFL